MKRWGIITVLLYVALLALLAMPAFWLAFCGWGRGASDATKIFSAYGQWEYWIIPAVFGLAQALLLLVPVDLSERRQPSRRKLLVPVLTSAFLMANLLLAGLFCVSFAIFGDKGIDRLEILGKILGVNLGWLTLLMVGALWLFWFGVFRAHWKQDDPESLMKRLTRWLVRGSILELLVAVPSHVIVRQRDDCCAPAGTFWGIACGLSVMLLAFGPGVFFLFAERVRRMKPARPPGASAAD